jgi:Caulimovirus viroplasmin
LFDSFPALSRSSFLAVVMRDRVASSSSWAECAIIVGSFDRSAFSTFGAEYAPMQSKQLYAVRRGRRPGIYTSWSEAHDQVCGYKNNLHKKFGTLAEAVAFMGGDAVGQTGGTSEVDVDDGAVRSVGKVPLCCVCVAALEERVARLERLVDRLDRKV